MVYFSAGRPLDASVYDAAGVLVLSRKAARSIDVAPLPAGLYLIRLTDAQGVPQAVHRLLKE
jgi:hypothetical protein